MKKALAIVAVALVAIASQAASVKWTANKIGASSEGSDISTYTAYFFITANTQGGTVFDKAKVEADITAGKFTGANGTYTQKATVNKLKSLSGTYDGGWANGDSVTGFIVIFDSADTTSGNAIITGTATTSFTSASGAPSMAFGAQNNATWTPVPEPCTVALVALGLAAFGLKRRVA